MPISGPVICQKLQRNRHKKKTNDQVVNQKSTAKGPKAQFETGRRRRRGRMCRSHERDGQPMGLCDSRYRSTSNTTSPAKPGTLLVCAKHLYNLIHVGLCDKSCPLSQKHFEEREKEM